MSETKILGLPASRRMRGLVYMASRDKVDVDTFYKGIQYALERLGKSKFGFESTTVSNFKSKSREGSGNELFDYSRAPCLGADQKARGLWERDWVKVPSQCAYTSGHHDRCLRSPTKRSSGLPLVSIVWHSKSTFLKDLLRATKS